MTEVNGQQYQHATTKAVAVGKGGTFKAKTLKKIAYNTKAPKERTNDGQGQTDGFTIKKEEIDSSMSMKQSEWYRFRKWLLDANPGKGVLQCQFDLSVSFGNAVNALKTDTCRGVMIQEEPRTSEDNQDVLMVDLPLFVFHVDYADGPAIVYEE
jgi:hypothetical protein